MPEHPQRHQQPARDEDQAQEQKAPTGGSSKRPNAKSRPVTHRAAHTRITPKPSDLNAHSTTSAAPIHLTSTGPSHPPTSWNQSGTRKAEPATQRRARDDKAKDARMPRP